MREEPTNLSRTAGRELIEILRDTIKRFGPDQAAATEERLMARGLSIQKGHTRGQQIEALQRGRQLLYHYEKPWLIAFRPTTREVVRIVHARRDLVRILLKVGRD